LPRSRRRAPPQPDTIADILLTCIRRLFPLALVFVASAALAQDFQQGAPRQLPRQAPGVPAPPAAAAAIDKPSLSAVVVPVLNGLVFLPSAQGVVPEGIARPADGIDLSRVPLLSDPGLRASLQGFLGKPASLADLDRITKLAIQVHRAAGRPLVDVVVPPQDVSGGVVQIVVAEFRVGDVKVESNKHFTTRRIREAIRLAPGSVVDQPRLIEDLNWLAQNPFRRLEVVYRPGAQPLTTDVVVRVNDRLPLRVYAGFDNSGLPSSQRARLFAGLNWGDVFGGDGQFSYQATVSPDVFKKGAETSTSFAAHSFTLSQPLPGASRDTLLLFGTVQNVAPRLGQNLGQTGKNLQGSARWIRTLRADPANRILLTLGWDFKQSDNNLLFGGTTISRQITEVQQAVAELSASSDWSLGRLTAILTTTASPGGIGARNSDVAFQPGPDHAGTPFARAQYLYAQVTAAQTIPIGGSGYEARTRFIGQLSTANLLPSEQLSAAGLGSVRGYDPNVAIGTRGFLASQELWLPPVVVPELAARAQVGVFIEAGQVGNIELLPNEARWTRTAATGLSANMTVGPWLNLRADYGMQLRSLPGQKRGSLVNVSASTAF